MKARQPSNSWKSGPLSTRVIPSSEFLGLSAVTCHGQFFGFASLEQKITIVINVAEPRDPSQNVNPQHITNFKELAALYDQYHDCGLEILAFPCDQLGSHTSENVRKSFDVSAWCKKMGFKFCMMQKVDVNGVQEHPVYTLLKQQGPDIRGNFQTSFLVLCNGDRCKICRFDGLAPRALRSRIDAFLNELEDEAVSSSTMTV